MVTLYNADADPPRQAGRFHCAGCMGKTIFWIAEGQEYSDFPDLECSECGFEYVSYRNERTGDVTHQIGKDMRDEALAALIEEQQDRLLRAGFVVEDVRRVVGSSK